MLIFCHLSPAAGLAVWHVWWMVLHWYCCPLTSTHCHQSRNKGKEKQGGWKESCSKSSRCFLLSTHTRTHAHTQCLYASTYTAAPLYQCKHMTTNIKAHTHTCTLAHTLITCILLQYVFAEQSLFPSARLTSFLLSPPQTTPTNVWCNNHTAVQKAFGSMQTNRHITANCIFAILTQVRNDEAVDECTLVNSWK